MTIISVPKSKSPEFARSLSDNPMVDVIRTRTRNASVEYEIDAPSYVEFPSYAVEL